MFFRQGHLCPLDTFLVSKRMDFCSLEFISLVLESFQKWLGFGGWGGGGVVGLHLKEKNCSQVFSLRVVSREKEDKYFHILIISPEGVFIPCTAHLSYMET